MSAARCSTRKHLDTSSKALEEVLGETDCLTVPFYTKKLQIRLATTRKKNEQQQDAKNNSELQTKWTKTTWKTIEQTIRQGRNRSIKA
jgi:hypothetical protein